MKNIFLFLYLILLFSCSNEKLSCESFNFKRIPYDSLFYYKELSYTNGYDTLHLPLNHKEFSRKTEWGYGGFGCNPSFSISHSDKHQQMNISYSFHYYAEGENDTATYFNLMINSSRLELKLDSIRGKITKTVVYDDFQQLNNGDMSRMIKRISFENMKVTSIETYTDVKWDLIDR